MHTRQVYDANDQLTGQQWTVGDTTYSQVFTYSKTTGVLSSMTPGNGHTLSLNYDALQRLSSVTGGIYEKSYTYRDISATQTTTQVSELTYDLPTDIVYGYTYDAFGNIATYSENGTTYAYTYSDDSLHQLLSQTGGGKAYTYTYDGAGNILTASDGNTTHTYKYGYDDLDGDGTEENLWKDLLIRFDGESILYDDIGNPTSYYNGTRWTMDWREGRRLVTANGGGKVLSFTYDSDGLRLTKKVGSTTYHYSYAGGKLMRQTGGGNTLDFFYDESGHPYALKYNGTTYYYVTNLQGDVLHIVDASGAAVVSYTYDPYGKPLTTDDTSGVSLGTVNPLRYRGYVYDSETGFYYLQSRYYDPAIGRFINADSYASTGQGFLGYNMFAYCLDNPVCRKEITGAYSADVFDDDSDVDHTDDDQDIHGGKMPSEGGSSIGLDNGSAPQNIDNRNPPQNVNDPKVGSSSGKSRTPDQQALHDIAKEINQGAKQGKFITHEEAKLIDAWAEEYGVYQHHGAIIGSGSHWVTGWNHTHIYNIHVPFVVIY